MTHVVERYDDPRQRTNDTNRPIRGTLESTEVPAVDMNSVMPTRTVAYLRVSTDGQADTGHSLDAQRAKVVAYAALYDLDLVEVVVDAGESAKTLARPGLGRVLGLLRDGAADAVLVTKLDRLTRSVRDLGELVETYFADGRRALLSVSEQIDTRTAAGRLVLNVLGSVSQWERETIGERTREVLAHKKAQGQKLGGRCPFGFEVGADGRSLVPRDDEQRVIATIRRLNADGLGHTAIVARLRELDVRSRAGTYLGRTQVARVLAA